MRKNRKNSSHTRGNKICIAAFLLICSLMLGGCGVKKEKAADSELPEIMYNASEHYEGWLIENIVINH